MVIRESCKIHYYTLWRERETCTGERMWYIQKTSVLPRVKYSFEINRFLFPLEVPIDHRENKCTRLFQEFSDVFITARFISA